MAIVNKTTDSRKPVPGWQTVQNWLGLERTFPGGSKLLSRLKLLLLGQRLNDGLLFKLFLYIILTSVAVLYLSPLFYMVSTSFKTVSELLDTTVKYFPRTIELNNYTEAFRGLEFFRAVKDTAMTSIGSALLQMASCALTGYAFARLNVPFKNTLFVLVLLTFLIPPQTLSIPLFVLYSKLGWLNTPLPFLVPALFSQGIKGSLFVLIFRQFFAMQPKELEESARIDGAGALRTYWKIMLPLARPAMLTVFLFSFIWHWNAYFEPSLFLRDGSYLAMSQQMNVLQSNLNVFHSSSASLGGEFFDVNEPIKMAAASLMVLPPLLLYMFAQRYFVQGIERTGIVE